MAAEEMQMHGDGRVWGGGEKWLDWERCDNAGGECGPENMVICCECVRGNGDNADSCCEYDG